MPAKHTQQNSGLTSKSCRACRIRHRKYDETWPVCERCSAGGLRCLGYELSKESRRNLDGTAPLVEVPENIQRLGTFNAAISSDTSHLAQTFEHSSPTATLNPQQNERALVPPEIYQPRSDVSAEVEMEPINDHTRTQASPIVCPPYWQAQPSMVTNAITKVATPVPRRLGTYLQDLSDERSSSSHSVLARNLGTLFHNPTLAKRIHPLSVDDRDIVRFIVTRYEGVISNMFFTAPHSQALQIRGELSQQAQFFPADRLALLLCAKVFDSMLDSSLVRAQKSPQRLAMVKRFEEKLRLIPVHGLALAEAQSLLGATLEILIIKLRTISGKNAHTELRKHAPIFLKIVFSDLTPCSSSQNLTSVPIARVLASTRHRTPHFALLDMLYSMACGLPQVIGYDTSEQLIGGIAHPLGWLYGFPPDLQIILIDLNQNLIRKQSEIWQGWQHFEQRLWAWQPTLGTWPGEESRRRVGRLASQESWRHTLLIYFYLAICGLQSDDPRIRSSVQQVFQIMSTIKQEQHPLGRIDFSTQYLFAGACTPRETQRDIAREQLSDSRKSGHWLLDGSAFVPVLDHLWHGAAAGGRAIRWSDYLYSRRVALPVPT